MDTIFIMPVQPDNKNSNFQDCEVWIWQVCERTSGKTMG